jgi:hypothetical protein
MADCADDMAKERRCVQCSADARFVDCATNSSGAQRTGGALTVQAGYAELNVAPANGTRHFFRCPFGAEACPAVRVGPPRPGHAQKCNTGYTGPLCGACDETYALSKRGCVDCGDRSRPVVVLALAALLLVAAAAALIWLVHCDGRRAAALVLWLSVAQRVWPRLKQSLAIFASNYQIVSKLPAAGPGPPGAFKRPERFHR